MASPAAVAALLHLCSGMLMLIMHPPNLPFDDGQGTLAALHGEAVVHCNVGPDTVILDPQEPTCAR
jgi:hypothetical protein